MPDQAQFPGQRPNEQVVFKLRRHWFILLKWLLAPLILFGATVGVGVGIGLAVSISTAAWVALIVLLGLLPLSLLIWRVLDWENDHYILTNERILHIERVYFLFESREEAALDKIQDVTVRIPTLTANLFYFGDVVIETASTAGQIKFESVGKPREVQQHIFTEAGLPEAGMKPPDQWEAGQMRIMRPLEVLTRMLYPLVPREGDVVIWRKHWFVLFTKLLKPLLATLISLVIWLAVISTDVSIAVEAIPDTVILVLPAILLLMLIGWIAWVTIDWHNDQYVLTPTHVIDIEKRPFTMEFRREANLGQIQNVSYEQPTFVSKFLDYGNTRLETAGRLGEFTFDSVPQPREVQAEITRRLNTFRRQATLERQEERLPRTQEELEKTLEKILSERYGLSPRPPGDPTRGSTSS